MPPLDNSALFDNAPPSRRPSKAELRKAKKLIKTERTLARTPHPLVPKTEAQREFLEAIEENDVVLASGGAGVGKTYCAARRALEKLLAGDIEKIVVTRPMVAVSGENIGFLPGSVEEKCFPWAIPIIDAFNDGASKATVEKLMKDGKIVFVPFALMRGRAQPLTSPVQTPTGARPMGDLAIGDAILGSDGSPTHVTGIFPQGRKKVFRIEFSDGLSTEATEDHLWPTATRSEKRWGKGFTVKTTAEIVRTGVKAGTNNNHEVPVMSAPAQLEARGDLPLHPYLLGVLLGDANLDAKVSVKLSTADPEIVEAVAPLLPPGIVPVKVPGNRYDWRLCGAPNGGSKRSPLKDALRHLGAAGKLSYEKRVPDAYLYASPEDRLALLRGLMDTDGGAYTQPARSPRVEFYSTSPELAEDVAFLVRSLGGVAKVRPRVHNDADKPYDRSGNFPHRRDSFVVRVSMPEGVNPFHLARKAEIASSPGRLFRFITSVTEVGEAECQCISVAAEDRLYLTDDFLVTHNTFSQSIILADESQNLTIEQAKVLITRVGEGSKIVVSGDNSGHQSDIKGVNGLDFLIRVADRYGLDAEVFEFDDSDVVRSGVAAQWVKAFAEHGDRR